LVVPRSMPTALAIGVLLILFFWVLGYRGEIRLDTT
jgi:hypothetical protein